MLPRGEARVSYLLPRRRARVSFLLPRCGARVSVLLPRCGARVSYMLPRGGARLIVLLPRRGARAVRCAIRAQPQSAPRIRQSNNQHDQRHKIFRVRNPAGYVYSGVYLRGIHAGCDKEAKNRDGNRMPQKRPQPRQALYAAHARRQLIRHSARCRYRSR